jgi:hypothetical protein
MPTQWELQLLYEIILDLINVRSASKSKSDWLYYYVCSLTALE